MDDAHARVTPDTVAKILFTSGSTGRPKGVVTTQRMLCSNQEMLRTLMGFLADEPPVLCDWLPWNHTFGGSHNFGIVLYNGGTLYIDEGKPTTSAGFAATVANLREIATTAYFNVPKGYEMLVPALRADQAFRAALLQPPADSVLRRRRPEAAGVGRLAGSGGGCLRRRDSHDDRPGRHRERADGACRPASKARRQAG